MEGRMDEERMKESKKENNQTKGNGKKHKTASWSNIQSYKHKIM